MADITEVTEMFKLHKCDVKITVTGGRTRHQAMHDLMTFIDSKKKPRKRRAKKGADKDQTDPEM